MTEYMDLCGLSYVKNLPDEELEMLCDLVELWYQKRTHNMLRIRYYDAKNKLKDLGISIPPPLKDVETVVGWPAKAVDSLAARSRFECFTSAGNENEKISNIFNINRFKLLYHQAVVSELTHSCSFITLSKGKANEPEVILNAYSALCAAAMWDDRAKRLKCGLTVVEIERKPNREPVPVWVNLYTNSDIWEVRKEGSIWVAYRHPHKMGRPMMEALVYCPTLDRPFGKSRISRAVMSITDSAVRTALRSEVTSEFFTAPQKYLLGADDSVFETKGKWETYIGSIVAFSENGETGEKPTYGQLAQASMQPHTDYMRSLAARFSGETNIPISELGVIHDNPASAEAIYAAKEPLVIEAEWLNETNGEALKAIAQMTLAIIEDKSFDELSAEELSINPRFKNPAMPSIVSQSDAVVKMISAIPALADSDISLEELGFNEEQIERINLDKRRMQAQANLQAALSAEMQEQ